MGAVRHPSLSGGRQWRGPSSQRLLVVDDRPTTREIVELTLRRIGYQAVGVASGAAALDALEQTTFDLVITDLAMPHMDGFELLRAIREQYSSSELPVVILTVKEEGEDLVSALKQGANDYVKKPINYPVLFARLEAQLNMRENYLRLQRAKATSDARSETLENLSEEFNGFGQSLSRELRASAGVLRRGLRTIAGLPGNAVHEPQPVTDIETLFAATERMDALATDLTSFASAAACKLSYARVNLSVMAEEIWRTLEAKQPDRAIALAIEEGMVAHTDAQLARLILECLLDNAWKYTSFEEHGSVSIGLRYVDGRKTYYVRDNGVGFDTGDAERIFRIFERLPAVHEIVGTGVGLAIVKRAVRRLGGKAWAEGVAGEGATVTFTLGEL